MTFDELEAKGNELVEKRNKASGSERELINKEISSIRQAQLKALAEEVQAALKLAIPEMVSIAIKSSNVNEAIEKGDISIEETKDWMRKGLQGIFENEKKTLVFEGYNWYIKKT